MRMIVSLVLITLFAGSAAIAEVVEIPLVIAPEGLYVRGIDFDYELPFDAAGALAGVSGASLQLVGSYDCLTVFCWQFGDYGGSLQSADYDPGLYLGLLDGDMKRHETTHQLADISEGIETVEFDLEIPLVEDSADATWEMLAGGTGTVYLRGFQCPTATYPTVCECEENAVITAATLRVVIGEGVPEVKRTWGAIKSLYR